MAPTFDPFKILGIGADATDEEVKRAYRAMVSKYHQTREVMFGFFSKFKLPMNRS